MSRANIDLLFQVTGADRGFTLPRGDEPRPPFGDHLSLASGTVAEPSKTARRDEARYAPADDRSTTSQHAADDDDDRSRESISDDTASTADEPQCGCDPPAETDSHMEAPEEASVDAEASGSAATSKNPDDDSDTYEESELHTEAAGAQAVKLNQPAAEAVAEISAENGAAALDDQPAAATSSEPHREFATKENGARSATVVDEIAETSAAAVTIEHDADAANIAANGPPSAKGNKKSHGTGASAKTPDDNGGVDAKVVAGKLGAAQSDGEDIATTEAARGGAQIEQASAEQLAGGEQSSATDELNGSSTDRTSSRPRDVAAIANRIVAAAVNGAAPTNNNAAGSATSEDAKPITKQAAAKTDALTAATGRLHSQNAAGKRGAKTNGEGDLPQVDAARFVGRVAKAFQTAHERGGTLQLRLSPPELGALRLELTVKDGVMSASLETENASARRVLLDHLPALRERLAEQNIRVERFDVDVRRESGGQEPAPQNQQHSRQNDSESRRQPAAQSRTEEAARTERPVIQLTSNSSGINLVA